MKPSKDLAELSRCLANEIATLTNRLVSARTQELIRQLDAARKAVEAAATPIDSSLNVPGLADDELQKIRERLSSNAAMEALRKQLQDRAAAAESLTADRDRAKADLTAAKTELEAERKRAKADLTAATTELEAERKRAKTDLTAATTKFDADRERAKTDLTAATTELEAERKRSKADLTAATTKFDADRERAKTDLAAVKTELEAERKRAKADLTAATTGFEAERERAKTDLTAVKTELEAERKRTADLTAATTTFEAERERAKTDLAAVKTELAAMRATLDAERERATAHQATQTQVEAEYNRLSAELASARAELEGERERVESSRAEATRMAAEFEATIDELRREHLTAAEEQAVAYTALPLDAMLTVFNALKRARTSAEALACVVEGLAREFSRVALFTVHNNRLEGARQVGFDFEKDISKLRLSISKDSLLSRAVSSGQLEAHFPTLQEEATVTLPFGGTPTCAMAIPFVIQGVVIAIIYADDSDSPEFATSAPQTRAKFAELLQQHAGMVLLSVGLNEKAESDLRGFASLLVEEMEYAHTADVNAGRNPIERQQTLRDKLESSRRMHAERTNDDVAAASTFEEYLASVAEARPDSAFGGDLATVLGLNTKGPRASVITMRR